MADRRRRAQPPAARTATDRRPPSRRAEHGRAPPDAGLLLADCDRAWAKAAAAAAEALPLTAGTGHAGLTALPDAELAVVAALRGDDAADRHLTAVAEIRDKHPVGITDGLVVDLTNWARALRTAAYPAVALHHLEQIGSPGLRRMAALDRLETAVRAGRTDRARAWLAELEDFADGTGTPSAVAVVEHGRALLAAEVDAETHFRRALDAHAGSLRLPDRARSSRVELTALPLEL